MLPMGHGYSSAAAEVGTQLVREDTEPSSCVSLRTGEPKRRVEGVGDNGGH